MTGPFINSDLIEKKIASQDYIDLQEYDLKLSQSDLDLFYKKPSSISLLNKAKEEGHQIDITIKENIIVDKSRETHSYEASLITSLIRHHLVQKGKSYAFESVFSHPSKIDEIKNAKDLGYKTYLYFVCLDDAEQNISRVSNRVEKGGHNVPNDKIVARYECTLNLLFPALTQCDKAYLFDNSTDTMELIAKVKEGELEIMVSSSKLPNWFVENVLNRIK